MALNSPRRRMASLRVRSPLRTPASIRASRRSWRWSMGIQPWAAAAPALKVRAVVAIRARMDFFISFSPQNVGVWSLVMGGQNDEAPDWFRRCGAYATVPAVATLAQLGDRLGDQGRLLQVDHVAGLGDRDQFGAGDPLLEAVRIDRRDQTV